jgi:uncharacterized protein (UPF0332 family)
MSPRDFLDTADDLAAGARESDWRSAVSRAYYAAFHTGRALLRQIGFPVPDADSGHQYASRRLAGAGRPDISRLGNDLAHLRGLRKRADYDLHRPLDQAEAIDLVQAAREIIDLLEQVAATPHVRDAIRDAMRAHERDILHEATYRP